jgi:hypothetical protein
MNAKLPEVLQIQIVNNETKSKVEMVAEKVKRFATSQVKRGKDNYSKLIDSFSLHSAGKSIRASFRAPKGMTQPPSGNEIIL